MNMAVTSWSFGLKSKIFSYSLTTMLKFIEISPLTSRLAFYTVGGSTFYIKDLKRGKITTRSTHLAQRILKLSKENSGVRLLLEGVPERPILFINLHL